VAKGGTVGLAHHLFDQVGVLEYVILTQLLEKAAHQPMHRLFVLLDP